MKISLLYLYAMEHKCLWCYIIYSYRCVEQAASPQLNVNLICTSFLSDYVSNLMPVSQESAPPVNGSLVSFYHCSYTEMQQANVILDSPQLNW